MNFFRTTDTTDTTDATIWKPGFTANGECSTSCRQNLKFAMFSCYILRIIRQIKAFKYYVQCFLVQCFSGVIIILAMPTVFVTNMT